MTSDPDQQRKVDLLTAARAQPGSGHRPWPIPLDPDSLRALEFVACAECRNGRQGDADPEDEGDVGIRGCCNGFGVQLVIPEGLELLVLHYAAKAVGNFSYEHRGEPGTLSESWCDDVEVAAYDALAERPPHKYSSAQVAATWPDSAEERRELELLDTPPA